MSRGPLVRRRQGPLPLLLACAVIASLGLFAPGLAVAVSAQAGVTVTGRVVYADDGSPLEGVTVRIEGTSVQVSTGEDGAFTLTGVPPGARVILVRWRDGMEHREPIEVPASGSIEVSTIEYDPDLVTIRGVSVTVAWPVREPIREAPAAIDVVNVVESRGYSSTGQHPQVLASLTAMDVSANGIHDFNVNTRGFNADLSQRMLVLMDGRDLAIPFLAAQEWSALSLPLEDIERIEVLRGPGSALYGANAYNGVINIVTPPARDVIGTKVSVAGGELGTLRGDLRHAATFGPDGRFGVRANIGYYRSDDWHSARTNLGDLEAEYGAAVDVSEFPVNTPPPGYELAPLFGQSFGIVLGPDGIPLPGPTIGTPDPVENVYGSARVDVYGSRGSSGTFEGGAAHVTNQLFMTNVGRFQVEHAWRPWARAAWTDERFHVTGWYSGRSSDQRSLASSAPIEEVSSLFHVEGQWNGRTFDDRAQLVFGSSYRRSLIDSKGTLVAAADDARNDWYGAGFGQLKFEVTPELSLVVAARLDGSNLFESQVSPKGALVYAPGEIHSFRVSAGKAYQTPRMTNFFLNVPLGAPANLTPVEAAVRAMFPTALAGVPVGELFTRSDAVPALALGNKDLGVERVTSYEAGYRGEIHERFEVTVDGYYSIVQDFVSALLPYANSAYGPWVAPATVPTADRSAVEAAVLDLVTPAAGLSNLADGSSAIVFSYGNAGRATEWGLEVGAVASMTDQVTVEGNYALFDHSVDEGVPLVPGDLIVPNTPRHRGNLRLMYNSRQLEAWAGLHFKSRHDWSSGFFRGPIPGSQRVDAGLGYRFGSRFRAHATATNLFDQSTYHIYGGSIDRRRVIFGLTAYPR